MSDSALAAVRGQTFWKLSGSGNDFVFFDARRDQLTALERPESIATVCQRGTGIGADGVVFLGRAASDGAAFQMRYYNSDGSRASMCGNAALCTTRLATELGAADPSGFAFDSDAGRVTARLADGRPQIDLPPIAAAQPQLRARLEAGERRMGFALAGVPHVVTLVDDLESVDVAARGAELRHLPEVGPAGANANFVAHERDGWAMRTFERGVEGETLACGTGAVAVAALLRAWAFGGSDRAARTDIRTRSGRTLAVSFMRREDVDVPSLAGEGRIVFSGSLGEL